MVQLMCFWALTTIIKGSHHHNTTPKVIYLKYYQNMLRWHSQTTFTRFWSLLITYLPTPCWHTEVMKNLLTVDFFSMYHQLTLNMSTRYDVIVVCEMTHYALAPQNGTIFIWVFILLGVYHFDYNQKYTYRLLQTIQMRLLLLFVLAEPSVLVSAKTALKFKYEI